MSLESAKASKDNNRNFYDIEESVKNYIKSSSKLILESTALSPQIKSAIELIVCSLEAGNKVIVFGNGGSAADSQHLAAELIGRFKLNRRSMPSIALTTDSSILTAVGNDYGFEFVFSRQCEALVEKGDVLIAISTSGKSMNVINGVRTATSKGARIISLVGGNGGPMKALSDLSIVVKSTDTAKIQEVQRVILHIICNEVEKLLVAKQPKQKFCFGIDED